MAQSHHKGFDRYSESFPEIGIAYIGEIDWTTYRVGRWHSHAEHQFLFIMDGFMDVDTLGKHFDGPPGALYVLPAEQVHIVQQREEPCRVRFLDLRLIAEPQTTLAKFLIDQGETQLHAREGTFRQMAMGLREALALPSPRKLARLQTVLWDALTELHTKASDGNGEEPGRVHLLAAEALMKDRITQPLDVTAIARAAGLSRSQLTRLYAKYLGIGPAERLRQLRIEKAREMLRGSTLSIKQIAHVCGFTCPNHFCRVFQQVTGGTPTSFRSMQAAG